MIILHHSINKKPIHIDYSAFTEKLRQILNFIILRLTIESELLSIRIIFRKCDTENCSREIFIINSALKTNPPTWRFKDLNGFKLEDLNGEKLIVIFRKKNCCWVCYKWVIIQNQEVILKIKSK